MILNDKIIFEVSILNGELNGNVKEYFFSKLKFDGKYKNGKINGKVKEYYGKDRLQFEGEYVNGKGIVYYDYYKNIKENSKIKFDGDYINGKMWNGKG